MVSSAPSIASKRLSLNSFFSFLHAPQSILKCFGKRRVHVDTYWHAVWQDIACLSPPRLVSKWDCYTNCRLYPRADDFHGLLPDIKKSLALPPRWDKTSVKSIHFACQVLNLTPDNKSKWFK